MPRKENNEFKPLTVVQDKAERVANQVLAKEICSIAEGVKQLLNGGLNEDAIVVLVKNAIPESYGISEKSVRTVLFQGLAQLERRYLTKAG